jgi:hypothetical protein
VENPYHTCHSAINGRSEATWTYKVGFKGVCKVGVKGTAPSTEEETPPGHIK